MGGVVREEDGCAKDRIGCVCLGVRWRSDQESGRGRIGAIVAMFGRDLVVRMCRRGKAARNDRIEVERFVVGGLFCVWMCQERCCMG